MKFTQELKQKDIHYTLKLIYPHKNAPERSRSILETFNQKIFISTECEIVYTSSTAAKYVENFPAATLYCCIYGLALLYPYFLFNKDILNVDLKSLTPLTFFVYHCSHQFIIS